MRTVTSSVDLNATPQKVWGLLTDTNLHSSWNPFITRMKGSLHVGSKLEVRIEPPGARPMNFRPTVTEVEPNRRLAWLGRFLIRGLFDGAHSFTLEALPQGRTPLIQSESFRGVLVPFSRTLLAKTAAGFEAMHQAMSNRIDGGSGGSATD